MTRLWGTIDIEKLKHLHSQGLTDRQIAKEMGENHRSIRSARSRLKLLRNNFKLTCECGEPFESYVSNAKYCPDCRFQRNQMFWARRQIRFQFKELCLVNPEKAKQLAEELRADDPVAFAAMGLSEIIGSQQA